MQAVLLFMSFVSFVLAQGPTRVAFTNVTGDLTSCSTLTFSWNTTAVIPNTPFNITVTNVEPDNADAAQISHTFSTATSDSGVCTWNATIPAGNYIVNGSAAQDANLAFTPTNLTIKANPSCLLTSATSTLSQSATQSAEGDSTPTSSPSTIVNVRPSLDAGDIAGIILGIVIVAGFVVVGVLLRRRRLRFPASNEFKALESQTNSTVSQERPHSRSTLRSKSPLPQLLSLPSNRPPIPHTEMEPDKLQHVLRSMK